MVPSRLCIGIVVLALSLSLSVLSGDGVRDDEDDTDEDDLDDGKGLRARGMLISVELGIRSEWYLKSSRLYHNVVD